MEAAIYRTVPKNSTLIFGDLDFRIWAGNFRLWLTGVMHLMCKKAKYGKPGKVSFIKRHKNCPK